MGHPAVPAAQPAAAWIPVTHRHRACHRPQGETRLALLVTATDPDQVEHAAHLVDRAGGASRLRLVYAGQSAGFAAALRIGIVLPRDVAVPANLRDHL